MNWIKMMFHKKMELLGSLRFWMITLAWAAAYVAKIEVDGFLWSELLLQISYWIGTVAGVGTIDKISQALKK